MDFPESDPLGIYEGTEIPFPARDSRELFQGSFGDRFPVRDSLELYSNETYSLRCEHSTNGRGILRERQSGILEIKIQVEDIGKTKKGQGPLIISW
jgi:hypothetical protein